MIHKVLAPIVQELNAHLKRKTNLQDNLVVLSELVDQSGTIVIPDEHKIVCMLTNIEQERVQLNSIGTAPFTSNPPIYLNLHLLFAAYFPGNYLESLKFISLVIGFFQGKPIFTPQNTTGLPEGIDKINLEISNLDQQAQHELWSAIGAKMMPSISMKLRMIPITGDQILSEAPAIHTTTIPKIN